jgi:dimethylargininase
MNWDIVEVPRADEFPDSVFIEDTLVMFKGTAIVTNPGSELRKPEIIEVANIVQGLSCVQSVSRITPPGTLDGGDVLKVGSVVYVGIGGRTNLSGAKQLADIVRPLGGAVITVPVSKVLHLKSAVTALPDETIVGYEPLVDDSSVFKPFLPVPEESGSHVVIGEADHILMAADAPLTAAMFRARGLRVTEVDIGEFIKLEGCVTCLSVRIR